MNLNWLDPRTWPPRTRWLFGVLATLGTSWVDYVTGNELRVYPLYYLPLTIAAWQRPIGPSVGLALTSSLAWLASNWLGGMSYSEPWMWAFNTGTQFCAFATFALLTSRLSVALAHETLLARTDPLTGLLNTRQFREELAEHLERVQRQPAAFALVFLDLDNFKWVNDNLGHKVGDKVLSDVATTLQATVRKTDTVARLGGDEFALLMPDTDAAQAQILLDRLRTELHALFAQPPGMPVSASMGAAVFHDGRASADALLQRADELMYQAKHSGKDRAVVQEIAAL